MTRESAIDVCIVADAEEMSDVAAVHVAALVAQKPDAILIVPAGATPLGLYRRLATSIAQGTLDLSRVTVFALDEWGGRSRSHPLSCHATILDAIIRPARISVERFFSVDGTAADLTEEAARYGDMLARHGPADLAILGLGINGHIGFNEPDAALRLATHAVALAPLTLQRARAEMKDGAVLPYGITIGIGALMAAKRVLLLAAGDHKAAAVAGMFDGTLSTRRPASFLHLHPNATVIMDEKAARLIR